MATIAAVVEKYDFVRCTEQDEEQFNSDLNEIEVDQVSKDQVLKDIAALVPQVSSPHFPLNWTPCVNMVNATIEKICYVPSWNEDVDMEKFYHEFYGVYLCCLQGLPSGSPTSGHIAIMDTIRNSKDMMDEFFQKLSGSDLKGLLSHYKKDYVIPPIETDHHSYAYDLASHIERILKDLGEDQLKDVKLELLDFWLFCKSKLMGDNEHIHLIYDNLGDCLESLLKQDTDKVFEELPSYAGVLEQWKAMKVLIEHPKFPENKTSDLLDEAFYLFNVDECSKAMFSDLMQCTFHWYAFETKDLASQAYDISNFIIDSELGVFLKDPTHIIDTYCPKVLELLKNPKILDTKKDKTGFRIVDQTVYSVLKPCCKTKADCEKMLEIVMAMLETGKEDFIKKGENLIYDLEETIDWKQLKDSANKLLMTCVAKFKTEMEEKDCKSLQHFAKKILDYHKDNKILKNISGSVLEIFYLCLETPNDMRADLAEETVDYFDIKSEKAKLGELWDAMVKGIWNEDDGFDKSHWKYTRFVEYTLRLINKFISENGVAAKYVDTFTDTLKKCVNEELFDEEERFTAKGHMAHEIAYEYLDNNRESKKIVKAMADTVVLLCQHDDFKTKLRFLPTLHNLQSFPEFLSPHVDTIIDMLEEVSSKDDAMHHIVSILTIIYPKASDGINRRLDDIVPLIEDMSPSKSAHILVLLMPIATSAPQFILESHLELVMERLDYSETSGVAIHIASGVAAKQGKRLLPYIDRLVALAGENTNYTYNVGNCIASVGVDVKESAPRCMDNLVTLFKKSVPQWKNGLLACMKTLGLQNKDLLVKHKTMIEQTKQDPQFQEMCQYLLDIIAERSLEGLSNDLSQQKDDVEKLDTRVDETEQNVANLAVEVDEQGKELQETKEDVAKVEERVDNVENTVEELEEKVEEVDQKTLSNAPAWSKEVSKLLNPETDHDWRLLSSRLGYSKEDIKNWATQHDPCMSMLSEWFATHKTSEATYGVLRALTEMNRTDAVEIVQKALDDADEILPDEPEEFTEPPAVFISYQWGHQAEVKLLKLHLEAAGFKCWMDIGQMGGGDKLFQKIDQGIRAAKVIICCVSKKYSKSDNCTREVNLSVNLGKPIIPLLMEKLSWPPEGAMGPIFGEYLFVRFFQREAELTKDERFWPVAKFQELIMQLRFHIVPDESMVTEDYKEWWNPPAEVIVIKKKEDKPEETKAEPKLAPAQPVEEKPEPSRAPPVFISYQWGKQPQIKALYGRLTDLGFPCWMDIHQMGGGDSLYDKIDKGVRGCDVVISCITTKYAKSANCRREVSLADALQKPIIPIQLDETPYPPEGPMSMVLTQLIPILFTRDPQVQFEWTGLEFDELHGKLKLHVKAEDMIDGVDGDANRGGDKEDVKKEEPKVKEDLKKEESHPKEDPKEDPKVKEVEDANAVEDKDVKPQETRDNDFKNDDKTENDAKSENSATPRGNSASKRGNSATSRVKSAPRGQSAHERGNSASDKGKSTSSKEHNSANGSTVSLKPSEGRKPSKTCVLL
ncbi:unnamed protein product [Owenia fusiformis]|uniref:Uncharacterized protein n=1 Tax=Owenia fusiformis TaxID=6347 RepID=A0A8J1UFI4_OWEFU|nr:unnamed protein product [Owenia fusiformis]